MEEINNFKQDSDETLFQAWERFKELLMKCFSNTLTEMQEVGFVLQWVGYSDTTNSVYSREPFQPKLNITLLYKSRQMTVPFPSRLDNHYCEEEEGNHRPKFTKADEASHINNTIPQKEKDPGISAAGIKVNVAGYNC
ncbi:hypothetical protein Tco_0532607 [Tanacetum coccineum]